MARLNITDLPKKTQKEIERISSIPEVERTVAESSFYNARLPYILQQEIFYTDAENGRIGININDPKTLLHLDKDQDGNTELRIFNPNTGNNARATIRIGQGDEDTLKESFSIGTFDDGFSTVSRYQNAGVFLTNTGLLGGFIYQAVNGGHHFGTNDHNDPDKMTITDDGNVGINKPEPDYKLHIEGTVGVSPGDDVTPINNGDVVVEATSNTLLTFKLKGSDGVVRSGTLSLS